MNNNQAWLAFQQMMAQQQQNMMLQNQFQLYLQFCQMNGLVIGHPNSFNLFFQQFPQPQHPLIQPQQFPQPNPFPQPQPQQFPQQQNSSYVSSNSQLQELIPRSDKTLYVNKSQVSLPNIINIAFKASSGLNVIINVDKNVTISDMFKQYMDRIGLSYKYLGNEIQFLHDGYRVDPFSNDPVYSKFKNNQSVVVYDQGSIVGAYD